MAKDVRADQDGDSLSAPLASLLQAIRSEEVPPRIRDLAAELQAALDKQGGRSPKA